jgi:2-C-methyl-D-erythritol 2,4-cyclodiphosphate synthase
VRVGIGYDSHRFDPARPLVLGGITIPGSAGLLGHSDADAICHALTDALLGAAAMGDIGRHFPDTDPKWAGANSVVLLSAAHDIVRRAGWRLNQSDVTVVAQAPKLAPYVEAMRVRLAAALEVSPEAISIKAKTNEGMGFIGRGEGIAVMAVATLVAV